MAVAAVGCGAEGDDREPVWSYISPAIIQPNCATASCHSPGAAVSGLDLSTAEKGFDSLTALRIPMRGMANPEGPRPLVTPFNPAQSRVVNMLRGIGTDRMPPDRPLPEADIRLIERWILAGAVND